MKTEAGVRVGIIVVVTHTHTRFADAFRSENELLTKRWPVVRGPYHFPRAGPERRPLQVAVVRRGRQRRRCWSTTDAHSKRTGNARVWRRMTDNERRCLCDGRSTRRTWAWTLARWRRSHDNDGLARVTDAHWAESALRLAESGRRRRPTSGEEHTPCKRATTAVVVPKPMDAGRWCRERCNGDYWVVSTKSALEWYALRAPLCDDSG